MRKICSFFFSILCLTSYAKVELPEIIGDNMVLQQNTEVQLWGKAEKNTKITVKTSWNSISGTTKSGGDGKWSIKIATPSATTEPQYLSISDGEEVTINNILIGEVWFCSGQSNMEMPLNGIYNSPIEGGNDAIAHAGNYPLIRCATIPKVEAVTPQETVAGKWMESNPENAGQFSATAFFFATYVSEILNVPVGIINCSWGGSPIEGWMSRELLSGYDDVDLSRAGNPEVPNWTQPLIMYNGMLKPIQNYTIGGFLWYQGESNIGNRHNYDQRMADMVELWRKEWGLGELPFYYVEIAPYDYGDANGDWAAFFREAQYRAQALIPNSGMVSTNDLVERYEADNIHPKNKKSIGKRLAYMALKNTYGVNGIVDRGPEYSRMEIKENEIHLYFNHAPEGFDRFAGMEGFEIAGEDRVFHPAEAKTGHGGIVVSSESVPNPVAVRYGFRNFKPGNVYNSREMPMVPFRTDNW